MGMIEGVIVKKLTKIADERGAIMHFLRNDDPEFKRFGEIYFSMVYPGIIKGWHLHTKMTLNYAVVRGMIKLVLFDGRKKSKTYKQMMELFIGEENHALVVVPPFVWNGFKGIGVGPAIVANCATHPHDPNEIKRMDPLHNDVISYNWDVVMK